MNRIKLSSLGLLIAFALLTPVLIADWATAQIQNITLPENTNNTRQIINLKDNTITLINKTTNETISIIPYTGNAMNATTNEPTTNMTFPGNAMNATTNEPTTNMTFPGNEGNTTTDMNLTSKFSEIQGK